MKRNLILFSCLALLFYACKKHNDNNDSTASSWTFGGVTYKAETVVYDNTGQASLSASALGGGSGSGSGLSFLFSTTPTTNGQVLITDSGLPNTVGVGVSTFSGINTKYYVSDATNVKANITITNGKISVSFPGTIWMHNLANSADSAQLSVGTITQQ